MDPETENHTGPESTHISRLKLFLALSRTPHGVLDMATPALGALLWLGTFPPAGVIALRLLTAFAGYTAVYALNDVVDYRVDKEEAPGEAIALFNRASNYPVVMFFVVIIS